MTEKQKRFPLPLSSIAEKNSYGKAPASKPAGGVATPQTATSNAALHAKRATPVPRAVGPLEAPRKPLAASAAPASVPARSPQLVSDAVRKAMTARVAKQGVKDAKVLAAMEAVPRHLFVEPALSSQAYIDASLPIGYHQTISQPYIVARMIEVLRANDRGGTLDRVLEIGTGCGYQAAVLSLVAKEVYSIERIKGLHELAKSNLRPMRVANIRLHYGDGMLGLPQVAPFDGIILAAAGLEVPQALLDQMAVGGRLVAPVGERHQVLQLIERIGKFEWRRSTLEDCHFVPLRPGTVG
ncbi:MAG TPA: protein-L-isoaspartate(D-aspartate) O-methyltransferase [Oxalicibacterium sp.]|jgi:protein-L-isoaspartate(D-aspartate) O-methyltransferase|nr:protein-L-isoaspartate(D-aspartate) O-methyltransferase [Oxalicibacterium sp.]